MAEDGERYIHKDKEYRKPRKPVVPDTMNYQLWTCPGCKQEWFANLGGIWLLELSHRDCSGPNK